MGRSPSESEREQLKLAIPREEAQQSLTKVILQGEQLLGRTIHTGAQLTQARDDFQTWYEYCERLLERIFNYSPWRGETAPSVYPRAAPMSPSRGRRPDDTAAKVR